MHNWNKMFNLIIEVKGKYTEENKGNVSGIFEDWLKELNEDRYNAVFDCLQFNQNKNFLLIRYGLAEMQRGMWEDKNSIFRECRSLVVDLDKEEIVLAPFRKFFNLDEVEENMYENVTEEIKNAKIVEVANKLDGSMQSARWYNGEVFMAGSMAIDKDNSWRLEDGYSMLEENYIEMIRENKNYTFIFEYISLKDAHVVNYEKEDVGLHLIGIRDVLTGRELNYVEIIAIANKHKVKVVELESKNLDELLKLGSQLQADKKEGWVINIDGRRIKIKCDDYVKLHRLLDAASSINIIIEAVADNKYDDLISKIPMAHRKRIDEVAMEVFRYKVGMEKKAKLLYDEATEKTDSRKEYMQYLQLSGEKDVISLAINLYLGREVNALKSKNKYKKASQIGLTY